MKKADLINIIKEDIQKLKNPELTKEKIDSAEELFNISATNPFGDEIYLYPHLDKGITLKNPQTYISIQENLKTINYFQGYSSNELKEWVSKHNFKQNKSNPNIYYSIKKEPTPLEEIANLFDILAKPEYKKIIKEQAYGSATLTTQGSPRTGTRVPTDEYPFSAMPKRTATGMYENREDEEKLADLKDELADKYQEMEDAIINAGEHIKGGGPVTDSYSDPIEKLEKEIRALENPFEKDSVGGRAYDQAAGGPSYDEVYLKSKLVGIKDAYEYDNERGVITIYPGLGSLQYKETATQEISFTKEGEEIHFVHVFGYQRTYQELKNVFPELPEMRGSSYSGFMNAGESSNIPVDLDTAQAMIQAMKDGLTAQSSDETEFDDPERRGGFTQLGLGRGAGSSTYNLEEQPGGDPAGQPDQQAAPGTGKSANKGPKPPKVKAYKHKPSKLLKKQIELMKFQWDNQGTDIYNQKQAIKYQEKTISTAPTDQKSQLQKAINDAEDGVEALQKSRNDLKKQIQTMKKTKTTPTGDKKSKSTREGFIRTTSKSLLNQYEQERGNSNLKEQMRSHKKQARRQILMEGAMKKFFEYFDQGSTNEEIVQLYAQKGVSVPEPFVSKARSQYEGLKKLKLELETSEQNFKDVSKMMVNNATEEFGGLGSEKQLASGLTK